MKLPLDKDSKTIIVIGDSYDEPNLQELLKGKEVTSALNAKLYVDSLEPRNRAERRRLKNKHKHTTIG